MSSSCGAETSSEGNTYSRVSCLRYGVPASCPRLGSSSWLGRSYLILLPESLMLSGHTTHTHTNRERERERDTHVHTQCAHVRVQRCARTCEHLTCCTRASFPSEAWQKGSQGCSVRTLQYTRTRDQISYPASFHCWASFRAQLPGRL
jgi:hypothetical protein